MSIRFACISNGTIYYYFSYISAAPAVDDIPSSKPLKPWLIGVIVLSIIVAIGATITVIQR